MARKQVPNEPASSMGDVERIAPGELSRALDMACADLRFVADRIAAIEQRLHPEWGPVMRYATALDTVRMRASEVADEEGRSE